MIPATWRKRFDNKPIMPFSPLELTLAAPQVAAAFIVIRPSSIFTHPGLSGSGRRLCQSSASRDSTCCGSTKSQKSPNDRDRGTPRGAAPPTPPGIRVAYLGGSTGLFDRGIFGTVLGLSTAIGGMISALGSGLVGFVRAVTGGYTAALLFCVMLKLVAAAIVLLRPRHAVGS
jgi:hypothetical protein